MLQGGFAFSVDWSEAIAADVRAAGVCSRMVGELLGLEVKGGHQVLHATAGGSSDTPLVLTPQKMRVRVVAAQGFSLIFDSRKSRVIF